MHWLQVVTSSEKCQITCRLMRDWSANWHLSGDLTLFMTADIYLVPSPLLWSPSPCGTRWNSIFCSVRAGYFCTCCFFTKMWFLHNTIPSSKLVRISNTDWYKLAKSHSIGKKRKWHVKNSRLTWVFWIAESFARMYLEGIFEVSLIANVRIGFVQISPAKLFVWLRSYQALSLSKCWS